jgi:5-methylthioadenosine/S-adenosylhomocysteine deaminase
MEENVLIIADGLVATCDPENRAGQLTIVIRAGTILEIGDDSAAILSRYQGAAVINAAGMLVVPGFVNAHAHSVSLLLREVTSDLPFSGWKSHSQFRESLTKLLAPSSANDVATLARAAAAAHMKSGTTALAEMPPEFEGDVYRGFVGALEESGIRPLSVVRTWEQLNVAREIGVDRHPCAMDLGAEEDFTVYSLESRIRAARDAGIPPLAHVGEMREGIDAVRRNFQKPVFQVLREFGGLQSDTMCAHLNHCTEQDAEAAHEAGCTVTVCVGSAMNKQTGYPFLRALTARDVRLAIGTDWGAFDVLAEARLLARIPALIPGVPEYGAVELLRMATINGAETLGIAKDTGSIEPGKRADLVLLKLDDLRIRAVPAGPTADDLAGILLRSPHQPAVSDVLVNGVFEVHNGAIVRQDEPTLLAGLQEIRRRWGIAAAPAVPGGAGASVAPVRARVLQLVPRDQDAPQGSPADESATPPDEAKERTANLGASKRRASSKRSPIHPELPKDVRRVFGDDDDS